MIFKKNVFPRAFALLRFVQLASFLFVLIPAPLQASLDSLLTVVQTLPDDEEKFMTYYGIARYYNGREPNTMLLYCDTMDQLNARGVSPKMRNLALYARALALEDLEQLDEALENALEALDIAESNQDSMRLAGHYNAIGSIYLEKDLPEISAEYYLDGIAVAESLGQLGYAAQIYYNLANAFEIYNDQKSAKQYYLLAKEKFEAIDNYTNHAYLYVGLGPLATNLDTAIHYLEKAIFYSHDQQTEWVLSSAYLLLGERLVKKGDTKGAVENYHKGLNYAIAFQDPYYTASAYDFLGLVHLEQGQLDSASIYLDRALDGTKEVTDNRLRKEVFLHLARLQDAKSGKTVGIPYWQQAFSLQDSIYQSYTEQQLQTNVARFENEKKERELAEQRLQLIEAENTRSRLLFGGITLLLVTAGTFQFFFYRQRRRKEAIEMALANEAREAERLREIDQLKTNFFTNVSHELRTPLTLVTSPLAEVRSKVKQVNLMPDLELAHENSKKLLGLINEILDLSKLEAGELRKELTAVQPVNFLRRVFFSFQSAADINEVELDWQAPDQLPLELETDVAKLEKILNNLLSNAVKFTPGGGRISLTFDEIALRNSASPRLVLAVTDTGKGIHPEDIPHVFERFYQSAQVGPQGGTGIGLSLSRQLAQLLGGDLRVESELGKGSRFLLEIPVTTREVNIHTAEEAGDSSEAEPVPSLPVLQFRSGRPQVLIVEDNAEMSKYLFDKLRADYDCHLAYNGAEALQMLQQQPFDLITSDVMMPVMDGFELREKINENNTWRRIPFLLLTARTLSEDKVKGFQLGIDDYVTKPFSLPELKARIHNLLENKLERETALEADDEAASTTPEQELIQNAEKFVKERLDDPTLSVEELAKNLGYSQRNLSRVMSQITGLTPVKFILELRLQHARHLLERRQFATVAEVRYEIGIESASYFTAKFKARFGCSPSEYLQK
ncbi:MAG: ATP-binding protein [Bacteroidota bacterium]